MEVKNDDITAPLTIRSATDDDYDAIVDVWRLSELDVRLDGRERRSSYSSQLRQFPETYLVAVDVDRVIGVVFGTHDHRKGWINRLAVDPACRRRGAAAMLVRACETALRSQGIDIVAALVEPGHEASAALFRSLGYRTDVPATYFRKPFEAGA